jgi:hypothetical protein
MPLDSDSPQELLLLCRPSEQNNHLGRRIPQEHLLLYTAGAERSPQGNSSRRGHLLLYRASEEQNHPHTRIPQGYLFHPRHRWLHTAEVQTHHQGSICRRGHLLACRALNYLHHRGRRCQQDYLLVYMQPVLPCHQDSIYIINPCQNLLVNRPSGEQNHLDRRIPEGRDSAGQPRRDSNCQEVQLLRYTVEIERTPQDSRILLEYLQ